MKEIALKYFNSGLSVMPVKKDKRPYGAWSELQKIALKPNGQFDAVYGIAIICGISDVECIDIDCKYDLTGTLFEDFKKTISEENKNILKKLTVEKTPTGGYHFIYRCKKIEANKKLASRYANEEEKKSGEKVKVLIETRGQGGYFVCDPTPEYKTIYGDLSLLQEITEEERKIIFDCALTFNEVFEKKNIYSSNKDYNNNLSPLEDFNENGEIIPELQSKGWKIVAEKGESIYLLRPGGTSKWSASYSREKKTFYVFSTSSEFEGGKAYNHSQVLSLLSFNGDFKETAKYVKSKNFGIQKKQGIKNVENKIENFEQYISGNETDEYLKKVRRDGFTMGLSTGFENFDKHWRFKPAHYVVINGHDNVGKSSVVWYLAVLSSKFHKWKWIIFSAENKTGAVKKKLMEYYSCNSLRRMSDTQFEESKKWVENNFTIIKNDVDVFTYKNILSIAGNLLQKQNYNALMIDPYNSLDKDLNGINEHQYDYRASCDLRLFVEKTKCSIYLNTHTHTEAARRIYPDRHEWAGHPMPPQKADTEGGVKFANKADDFLTIHRLTQHETEWMNTLIYVRKIRETESGGRPTPIDKPIILKMTKGSCGFEDEQGFNPMMANSIENSNKPIQTNFLDPIKVDDPF